MTIEFERPLFISIKFSDICGTASANCHDGSGGGRINEVIYLEAHSSIPSGQYLNYSRIESGQFNTSVVVFELPGDFYTFRITSGRPSTNLLFKTIQIRKWLS